MVHYCNDNTVTWKSMVVEQLDGRHATSNVQMLTDFHRRALRFDVLAHFLETHAPSHTIFPNARSKLRNNGNPQTVSTIFSCDQATVEDLLL